MTPTELLTLIASDPQATAYFSAGNDEACAARCSAIAPPMRQAVPAVSYKRQLLDLNIQALHGVRRHFRELTRAK